MNSTYVPLTVHDCPRRTNLYVNFAQTVNHGHTPANFNVPKKECVKRPFRLFTCLLPATPPSPIMRSRLDLNHVPHTSERCVYTPEWLHAHAKYSPYALPVKQIAFRAHA